MYSLCVDCILGGEPERWFSTPSALLRTHTFSHKAGLVRAEDIQEVRSDMGEVGAVRWSAKDKVVDALLVVRDHQMLGAYITSVGAHVVGVEMEKMGHFPLQTDEVSYSADVQQPPYFMSTRLSCNELCFDN